MESKIKYSLASGIISVVIGLVAIFILMNLGTFLSSVFEVIKWIVIIGSVIGLAGFGYAYWTNR